MAENDEVCALANKILKLADGTDADDFFEATTYAVGFLLAGKYCPECLPEEYERFISGLRRTMNFAGISVMDEQSPGERTH